MDWIKKRLAKAASADTGSRRIGVGDMYLSTASESLARAEAAIPGTRKIKPFLELIPPPIDPELVSCGEDQRDYGPDEVAEYSLEAASKQVFASTTVSDALTRDLRMHFALPTFFVRTPAGRITYMESAEAPSAAVAILAGWRLGDEKRQAREIAAGAAALSEWLCARPESFDAWRVDAEALSSQHERAVRIMTVAPDRIEIVLWPGSGAGRFDGKKVWRTLHALGLQWGDGDQFHWSDPTNQTDFLFSADVDDGEYGYALPEEIAAGRQHFDVIRFGFTVPRSPHPHHVLQEMVRAVTVAAVELNGRAMPLIDGVEAKNVGELAAAVDGVLSQLGACGVKAGSHSVCMLR